MDEGVGEPEVQVLLVPGPHLLRLGGVEDDVRQPHGNVLLLLDLAVGSVLYLGRDLDGATFEVEEAEPVATARGLQRVRLGDEGDVGSRQACGEAVDHLAVGRAECDQVQALLRGTADPHDVLLRRADSGEVGHVRIGPDLGQAPLLGVERDLLFVVGD